MVFHLRPKKGVRMTLHPHVAVRNGYFFPSNECFTRVRPECVDE